MSALNSKHENVTLQLKTNIGYFHLLTLAYALIFIISNTSAVKVGMFFGRYLDTGTLYFPLLYILNDVITEVYGFRTSRKVIWLTIACNLLFSLALYISVMLPGAVEVESNQSFNTVFAMSPRIVLASVSAFLIGEYVNSLVLSLSKIKMQGRWFGARAIFSTAIGVTIESTMFAFIAFYGVVGAYEVMEMTVLLVLIKVLYELVSLPITTRIVAFLKHREGLDYYDYGTKFNLLPW
jgi:uncharacterized integral membrane protein (TIGR00697 family)